MRGCRRLRRWVGCKRIMHTLHAFVQNLPMYGVEKTVKPDASWVSNVMRVTHGQYEFVIRQDENFLSSMRQSKLSGLRGKSMETTFIEVANVAESERESALSKIDSLCWLLSFASQSLVGCFAHSYPPNGGTKIHEKHGEINALRPVICIDDPAQLVRFVQMTFDNYLATEQERKLRSVIHYLHEAGLQNRPLEVKLILLFVALENLKYTFGIKQPGIFFVNGFFRVENERNAKTISLKKMCAKMFLRVHMQPSLESLIALRNDITHSGLSGKTSQQQNAFVAELSDLIREYILRLLNYHGEYQSHGLGPSEVRYIADPRVP
jgi:hypothetical protein